MRVLRIFLSGLAAFAVISSAALTAKAVGTDDIPAAVPGAASASSGVNVIYRTQDGIQSYIAAHPFSTSDAVTYIKTPDLTSPYTDAGALSASSLKNGLNALNTMRYIAGLSDVTLSSEYSAQCQKAAYISALNGSISHYPTQPDGVSSDIYGDGSAACGTSNLAAGYKNPAAAILGYMDDSDEGNIGTLGHRRWCLNPAMKRTGFGHADNSSSPYKSFSAMYAFDNLKGDTAISGVCWPAQNMPIEYFAAGQAWSYSLGSVIADPSAVAVTLTRKSDGKVWRFSNSPAGSGGGAMYVDNSGYGRSGCVIFLPNGIDEYKAGDIFTVRIDGLSVPVEYTVNFFSTEIPLTAVTGFSAAPSANNVSLKWNKNSAADSYQIDVYKNGKWTYLTKTTGTSYTVTGLSANTSYRFRIFAFKGSKHSPSVSVTAATKPAVKPTAVMGFSASTTANSVSLKWNKNSTADSYQIDMYKNGKWTYLAKTAGTSYNVTGLSSNTSYRFRIYAFNGSEHSSLTSVTAVTKSAGKLTAVTGFSASPSADRIKLSWNKNSAADSYQIDMYKNGKWTYLAKTSGTSYTAAGLSSNTSYRFRIYAFSGSEHSASASVNASTKPSASDKPSAVTSIDASPSEDSVKLTWSKSDNADSYQVEIYKNGKWTYLTKTARLTYTATGLDGGTEYKFRIYAFNGSEHSASARVDASTKPAAVSGLTAAPSKSNARLSWKASTGADNYQVDKYENGRWVYVGTTTDTTYNVTGLSSGYVYLFRVYAFKGNSHSASTTVTVFTL